MEVLIKWK